MAGGEEDDATIWVKSLVSQRTGEGLVEIVWGEKKAQLDVAAARHHAMGVLECCEAAETDELMLAFFKSFMSDADALKMVWQWRAYRLARAEQLRGRVERAGDVG